MTATLGEFLDRAGQRIGAATLHLAEPPAGARQEIISELDRLLSAMARYARDYPQPADPGPDAPGGLSAGEQSAAGAAVAISRAAGHLAEAMTLNTDTGTDAGAGHPVAADLRAAADALAAGHDLLQAHFLAGNQTPPYLHSKWAPVIASPPVASAMLREMTGYAQQLAPLAAQLSAPSTDGASGSADPALRAASHWLYLAGIAPASAGFPAPGPQARQLLRAIPANIAPARQVPSGKQSVAELCTGAIVTSERLRHLALRPAGNDHRPPAATSANWRHKALTTAITGHNSEFALRTLADRARQLGTSPVPATALDEAAEVMQHAWTWWRTVSQAWDILTTGRSRDLSLVAAEFGDLALWIGRIARSDPDWTPARSAASPIRAPTSLAPAAADIPAILAAIEQAADVTAQIGRHDRHAVGRVAAERGIYIPTRLLPEQDNLRNPRSYSPAPHDRTMDLVTAYHEAVSASDRAVLALRRLITAPTTAHVVHLAVTPALPAADIPTRLSPESAALPPLRARRPRELENLVHSLEITDPALLLRATALDQATQDLIAEATAIAQARAHAEADLTAASTAPGRNHPASLAIQAFPASPGSRATRAAPAPRANGDRPAHPRVARAPRATTAQRA